MKIRLTFKDPDGVSESLDGFVKDSLKGLNLSSDEAEALFDIRREKLAEALEPWVTYEEYVTIEIDTEAKTAEVVKDA